MKKIKIQYIIAPIFLFVSISLSMICASFNQEMLIDGEAYIRINKDVRIMEIVRYETTNGGFSTYNPKYSEISAITYDTLPNLNSTVKYRIKIRNNTNYYINVYDVTSDVANSFTNNNVTYEFDKTSLNSSYGSDLLDPSSEAFVYVTVKYVDGIELPEDTTNIATFKFKFSPIYASELSYSSINSHLSDRFPGCEDVQCALDNIHSMIYD